MTGPDRAPAATEARPPAQGGFGRAAARGVLWVTVGQASERIIGFAALAIVVRLMSLEEAGIVMLAASAFDIILVVSSSGYGDRIIQHPQPDRQLTGTVFWLQMMICSVLAGIFWLLSPAIGALFGEMRVVPLLQVMSSLLVLRAIGIVPSSLLVRQLRYGRVVRGSLIAGLAGAAGGIVVALLGHPLWSMVTQLLVASVVYGAISMWQARWLPPMVFSMAEARRTIAFSLPLVASAVLANVGQQVATLMVGLLLPIEAVALYRVAARLFEVMQQVLILPIQKVLLVTFAALGADRARTRDAFLKLLQVMAAIAFAAYGLVAAQGTDVMILLFGAKFAASGPLLTLICGSVVGLAMRSFVNPALVAVARTRLVLVYTIVSTLLLMAIVAVAARYGVSWVAFAQSLHMLLTVPLSLAAYWLAFRISPWRVLAVLPQPLLAALAGGLVSWLAAGELAQLAPELPRLLRMLAAGLPGLLAFAATHFLLGPRRTRQTVTEVLALMRKRKAVPVPPPPPPGPEPAA